jgi:hypothetical protein
MRLRFIGFAFWLFLGPLYTQSNIQWQTCLGGSNVDEARCIQTTDDGGLIVIGKTLSNNGDVSGNHGGNDFWVVRLNSLGTILWQKTLGGSNHDRGYYVQQTNDDGFIVVGFTESNNGDVQGNHGDKDIWVVKLNSTGIIQWQKTLGGSYWEEAWCVRQTSDNGFIVAGRSNSLDGDVIGNHGAMDFWVVKLTETGNLEWQKSLGGSLDDIPYSIKQTLDGGYIVAGTTNSSDGDVTGFHGSTDYWVMKLSDMGEIEWQKALGTTSLDRANDVFQTSDGGYFVVGEASANNGDVTGHHGGYDIWAVKLNEIGEIEWQKALGGSDEEFGKSAQQTDDGGYIIAGATQSTNGDVIGNDGGLDIWVVKLTPDGSMEWQKTLGGTQGDWGNSIQQTPENGFILAGYTMSNNGDVSGNHGSQDFWIVKLHPESTPTNAPQAQALDFYPNPTTQSITIQIPEPKNTLSVSITDLLGRELRCQSIPNGGTLELEGLADGLYWVTATTDSGKVFVGKVWKQE